MPKRVIISLIALAGYPPFGGLWLAIYGKHAIRRIDGNRHVTPQLPR
jgi:hypothetical protein